MFTRCGPQQSRKGDHRRVRAEQRRARCPDESGEVTRAGVPLHFDVYGAGATTLLLLPAWSIVDSRFWKAQVPFLARHHRVVTFDGRGSGRSGRPRGAEAFMDREFVADALAVLDATRTDRSVLIGYSRGATWAVQLAAAYPQRVLGVFAIAPACLLPAAAREGDVAWLRTDAEPDGWGLYNRHHWLTGRDSEFKRFYFSEMFPEPHSTKQIEDMLVWSADIDAQTLVDSTGARLLMGEPLDDVAKSVRCPVHVVHGTADRVRHHSIGEQLAEYTGGALTLVEGAGHGVITRDPVRVNTLIRDFVNSLTLPPKTMRWTRASRRRRRVLYLSSPIGLGHARRDIAIARELRQLRTDLDVSWLAQNPVTRLLHTAGEEVHPASRHLLGESEHIETEAGEHDLHAFQAIRRMDEVLVANFMTFTEVVDDPPDLVVADEAWEVDYFLHENPELKRFAFAWLTDFVGWLPMPDGGAREAALTADYNAEMLEQRARFPRLRDRSIFIGNPDDVVDEVFGPGLPSIPEWTRQHFDFAGYVVGSAPPAAPGRMALRRTLGVRSEQRLCVVTVGGTAVGEALLRRVLAAVPVARRKMPELRFLVVTGPRIDPASLPSHRGVRMRGFVPNLADYLAACDVAVVQGGLTTCMELTAAGTPFIYVPLNHHFEQQIHVRHRLDRYRAGRPVPYEETTDPDLLAKVIVDELSAQPEFRAVETDGAKRAASLLAELL